MGSPLDVYGWWYLRFRRDVIILVVGQARKDLTDAQRQRANCRAYANQYQRRGVLVPQPCEVCGSTENIEKHHDDYSKPLQVRWFCRTHHRKLTLHEYWRNHPHAAYLQIPSPT